jgi:hypothetical protein
MLDARHDGTDLDHRARMRLQLVVAALLSLLCWPLVVCNSLRARRRLKAYALPSGDGRLTLERVA